MRLEDALIAIRAKCMDCSGDSRKEVERCPIKTCALYPYRCLKAMKDSASDALPDNQVSVFDMLDSMDEHVDSS